MQNTAELRPISDSKTEELRREFQERNLDRKAAYEGYDEKVRKLLLKIVRREIVDDMAPVLNWAMRSEQRKLGHDLLKPLKSDLKVIGTAASLELTGKILTA